MWVYFYKCRGLIKFVFYKLKLKYKTQHNRFRQNVGSATQKDILVAIFQKNVGSVVIAEKRNRLRASFQNVNKIYR